MSNILQNEIDKFSKMAAEWWNPEGPCKPLHRINPLRLQFVKSFLSLKDKKIIDIGCGGGIFSESLARDGANVTGIDQSEALIQIAIQHAKQNKLPLEYCLDQAENLAAAQQNSFDAVCCMELLEHVPYPNLLIQACSDLAKPLGWVFFSTINRNVWSYLTAILGAEYIFKLLPKKTHEYAQFIRPSELAAIARKSHLSLKKIQGYAYNPMTASVRFCPSVQVNYLIAFQKNINS